MQRTIIGTYCFNMQMNTILILMATNQAKKRTSTWNEQFSGTLNCIISLQKAFPLTHQIGTFELDLQYSQTYEKPNLKSKISLSLFLNDAWFKFSSIKNSALSYWCGKPKKFLGLALKKKNHLFSSSSSKITSKSCYIHLPKVKLYGVRASLMCLKISF